MKRPQQSTGPQSTPLRPLQKPAAKRGRRRGRKLAVVLPVILAAAAAVSVGAAAYSRDDDHHDSAAGKAAAAEAAPAVAALAASREVMTSDEGLRGRAADLAPVPGVAKVPTTLDASSLKPTAAAAYREIRVDVGALTIGHDPTGVGQVSLPLHITNVGGQVRSFDVTIAARDAAGATITKDTGTAANLQPGQSAEVRVLDIVNDAMVERLRAASFAVTDVFAY